MSGRGSWLFWKRSKNCSNGFSVTSQGAINNHPSCSQDHRIYYWGRHQSHPASNQGVQPAIINCRPERETRKLLDSLSSHNTIDEVSIKAPLLQGHLLLILQLKPPFSRDITHSFFNQSPPSPDTQPTLVLSPDPSHSRERVW